MKLPKLRSSKTANEPDTSGTPTASFNIWMMILPSMLIVCLVGCGLVSMISAYFPGEEDPGNGTQKIPDERYKYLEQSNTENHEAGTIESIIEYGENSVIGAHYPIFEKEAIDSITKQFVEENISEFRDEVDDYETKHSDRKAELNIDYETWLLKDRLASIKFTIIKNMPYYAHPDVQIETSIYDLETEQPVLLKDIMVHGSLPKLAQIVRNSLRSNPDYEDYFDSDLFMSGTVPVFDNYANFVLTNEHAVFLFQKYQIFAGAAGEPKVKISYENLDGIFDLTSYLNDSFDPSGSSDPHEEDDLHESADYPRDPGLDEGPGVSVPVREIDPHKPMVALTFDDGPFAQTTGSILDTLKQHDAVATFFVLGNRVPDNEAILIRMITEGNEIGNHSLSHKQLTTLSQEELEEQIERTQKAVKLVTGIEPVIMRPTYGSYNDEIRENIDMPMILWSLDTRDWESRDASCVSKKVLENVQDGDIILMHDIYMSTAEAVKTIVPELKSRGYQLVTISELYEAKGVALEAGKIYRREAEK